jgi:hypothetical protein
MDFGAYGSDVSYFVWKSVNFWFLGSKKSACSIAGHIFDNRYVLI